MSGLGEFSFRSRETALRRFREESFDLLIIGGGITGAGVARDAISRGLSVALVEKNDFAFGTSSRSSKLIHGGLRYLQNFEFGLVFEALAERALLLKVVPHMVRPLKFFLPVYKGDKNGKSILDLGLWLYDLLALFRTPGFHKRLSAKKMLEQIPFLDARGLKGGFSYFDASMWDDVLAVETLRSAQASGAAVANYVEAVAPIWEHGAGAEPGSKALVTDAARIVGFRVRDREASEGSAEISVRAKRVIVCAGPWTDFVGKTLSKDWHPWLNPSKGVHLIFDWKRLPVPGAMVMNHPEDGRIAFVIPRPDMGAGVTIVGTTDGPTPPQPEKAPVDPTDVAYLMGLLERYFPTLKLEPSDILSAYVGVRPLVGDLSNVNSSGEGANASGASSASLQKISREHHIDRGPGGTVVVAGGKYTTHRKMAEEIVDFTLKAWHLDAQAGKMAGIPSGLRKPQTATPVNPMATVEGVAACREDAQKRGIVLPEELITRFGGEALKIFDINEKLSAEERDGAPAYPAGFPMLAAQLRYSMRIGMVVHLEDFYFRRTALYSSRMDHGLPWGELLGRVWASERGLGAAEAAREVEQLRAEIEKRSAWKKALMPGSTPVREAVQ